MAKGLSCQDWGQFINDYRPFLASAETEELKTISFPLSPFQQERPSLKIDKEHPSY